MFVRTFAILLVSVLLVGCSNHPSSKPTEEKAKQGQKSTPANAGKKGQSETEVEARAVLKTALDSWVFGDTLEMFEKHHPGISFFDTSRITKKMIGRYDIGTVRKEGRTFEFLVTLTFKEESGDVNRSGSYLVLKDAEGWSITGGAK